MKRYVGILAIFLNFVLIGDLHALDGDNIHIHGFISQGYLLSNYNNYLADTEKGSFEFNEMGINFIHETLEKLNIGMQLIARDLGPTENDAVTVDWAFADYRWKDYLGFRAGKIKNPTGLYHETRDVDMLRTNIFLPHSVYNENFRDMFIAVKGVSIYGEILLSRIGNFGYQLLTGTNDLRVDGGTATTMNGSQLDTTAIDLKSIGSGMVRWTNPTNQIILGGTIGYMEEMNLDCVTTDFATQYSGVPAGLDAKYDLFDLTNWVLSAELNYNSFLIAAEYRRFITRKSVATVFLPDPLLPLILTDSGEGEGYYISGSYELSDLIEIGAYYAALFPNIDNRDGNGLEYAFQAWRKHWVLSIRFNLNDNWLFKIEGHYVDGVATMYYELNPDGFERYWTLYAAKLSYSF